MVSKKAFTMIELVMVIVILGIVASIGSDIVLSLYNNYLRSRTINTLESKTEIVLEQIAKRLQYRIKDSTIARKADGSYRALAGSDSTYSIIEWISYSNESLLSNPPGWSGFIDLNDGNTTRPNLKTHDSNLSFASETMSALTDGDINLTVEGKEAALIFRTPYNAENFGWGNGNVNTLGVATLRVTKNNTDDDILIINATDVPNDIYEHYVLAHSAYAIVPEGNITGTDFNLTLHYNYQPWIAARNNYALGSTATLAEHVSLFQFKQDDTLIRLKLCIHDNNETGTGDRIAICKEKVVY
ncbi:type II secretion system protein [Sulfurospirillum barnesii]|uniref:Prepilin-type N-terminal cleavage/methylation domain-containing protein n=1 Tax=Sulfurospirillum barnesii (strain ATCC 700032 / DSM 10660 / SES-3) TaxID=760154 RepID=I3XW89_SULBS|nr:type II secretion system protein [Sulfurospirillum barnesii]AFL68213.1 prepilin-type N-terminal cleavage/methylation domain-containing protein [Sulfurospirillum barnesii SES-3]